MTNTQLLAWGQLELDRQMAEDNAEAQICDLCSRDAAQSGYSRWSRCNWCGHPLCDNCAVQVDDGHFCPACPKTLPF